MSRFSAQKCQGTISARISYMPIIVHGHRITDRFGPAGLYARGNQRCNIRGCNELVDPVFCLYAWRVDG
jgi:hypothetical protein